MEKPKTKIIKSFKKIESDEELLAQSKGKIANLRRKLFAYGFFEKTYSELKEIVDSDLKRSIRQEAAWEMAMWHVKQNSEDDARECLRLLDIATDSKSAPEKLRRAAIIKAECFTRLSKPKKAAETISNAIEIKSTACLLLAKSNLSSTFEDRAVCLNKVFEMYDLPPVQGKRQEGLPAFQRMDQVRKKPLLTRRLSEPLVTVIIPVFNCEKTIGIALESLLAQTCQDYEIIVADDCSTDATRKIVRRYKLRDRRIRLIRSKTNSGLFVARNLALKIARGKYVTCHNPGSWAHPEKIEIQSDHLENNPEFLANKTQFALIDDELRFIWPGEPGRFIKLSLDSLMLRRQEVFEKLGCWDPVRFGADEELILRLHHVFGEDKIARLETGPLTLLKQGYSMVPEYFGIVNREYSNAAMKEYMESFRVFLERGGDLKYEFPENARKYPIPEPLKPAREKNPEGRKHFDVIIGSEFRLTGGTTSSNVEQIKAQKAAGLKTGLVQMSRYDLNVMESINEKVRNEIDGRQVEMIVYGEKVSCDLLIIRHPPVLQEYQEFIPDIKAAHIFVVINTSPLREYSEGGERVYDLEVCRDNLYRHFGKEGIWCPIGPLVRDAVLKEANIGSITLSENNWHNIINTGEWYFDTPKCTGKAPVIGRHTRDQYVKWPENSEELLQVYPDDERFKVKILGGAKTVEDMLGKIPDNWEVYPFGSKSAKDFLAEIDFCVYFHHKDLVEAFGRTPLEAMAAGVPVILPEHFRVLFQEAAIYAKPSDVQGIILDLFNDQALYGERAAIARKYAEEHFGYSQHVNRIRPFVKKLQ